MSATQHDHPINRMAHELQRKALAVELSLGYLAESGITSYLEQRFQPYTAPTHLVQMLLTRTSGNPFFLVTTVDEFVRQGRFVQDESGWVFDGDVKAVGEALPPNIQYLIEDQLEQLSPDEQALLAAASVAGLEFASSGVANLLGQEIEHIEDQCDTFSRRGQFVLSHGVVEWPNHTVSAQYRFRHGLYQQVVYERIPLTRKVRWHRHMGGHLESLYAAHAKDVAVALAEHFVRGRDTARALHYLYFAGEQALQRSAHEEAKAHFTRGLELLPQSSEGTERDQQEVRLRMGLGPVLMARYGYGSPEAVDSYTRAYELCQELGDVVDHFPILWGLWQGSNARDHPDIALGLATQVYERSQLGRQPGRDPIQLMQGHHAMWTTLMHCGEYEMALHHAKQGRALYRPRHHHDHAVAYGVDDPGVCCLTTGADALWFLGYADQAREWVEEGLALARRLEHPFSMCSAFGDAISIYRDHRDFAKAVEILTSWMDLSREHGFQSSLAVAEMEWGAMLVAQQQDEAGIERIHKGLELFKAMGTLYQRQWIRVHLATAYERLGQVDKGLAEVQHGLQFAGDARQVKTTVELTRAQGRLVLRQAVPDEAEAEACFQRALTLSRNQNARMLELRAAMNLAELWDTQGKRYEALELLESVYSCFTEGFRTGDLQQAKRLLQHLGSTMDLGGIEPASIELDHRS